jgi:hypothetical protein
MSDLMEFFAQPVTRKIKVRGRVVDVRQLSNAEALEIHLAFERPRAPMIPDETRGSKAAPVPDTQDVKYQAGVRRWATNVAAARVAAAMDVAVGSTTWATVRGTKAAPAWCSSAAEKIAAVLSEKEIDAIDAVALGEDDEGGEEAKAAGAFRGAGAAEDQRAGGSAGGVGGA